MFATGGDAGRAALISFQLLLLILLPDQLPLPAVCSALVLRAERQSDGQFASAPQPRGRFDEQACQPATPPDGGEED